MHRSTPIASVVAALWNALLHTSTPAFCVRFAMMQTQEITGGRRGVVAVRYHDRGDLFEETVDTNGRQQWRNFTPLIGTRKPTEKTGTLEPSSYRELGAKASAKEKLRIKFYTSNEGSNPGSMFAAEYAALAKSANEERADVLVTCQIEAQTSMHEWEAFHNDWALVGHGTHWGTTVDPMKLKVLQNAQMLNVFVRKPKAVHDEVFRGKDVEQKDWIINNNWTDRKKWVGHNETRVGAKWQGGWNTLKEATSIEDYSDGVKLLSAFTRLHETTGAGKGGASTRLSLFDHQGKSAADFLFVCAHAFSETAAGREKGMSQIMREGLQAPKPYCVAKAENPERYAVLQASVCAWQNREESWAQQFVFYASDTQVLGTTAFCVSYKPLYRPDESPDPKRDAKTTKTPFMGKPGVFFTYRVTRGDQCGNLGWTQQFVFYAPRTPIGGTSPHCLSRTLHRVSQAASVGGASRLEWIYRVSQGLSCSGPHGPELDWAQTHVFYAHTPQSAEATKYFPSIDSVFVFGDLNYRLWLKSQDDAQLEKFMYSTSGRLTLSQFDQLKPHGGHSVLTDIFGYGMTCNEPFTKYLPTYKRNNENGACPRLNSVRKAGPHCDNLIPTQCEAPDTACMQNFVKVKQCEGLTLACYFVGEKQKVSNTIEFKAMMPDDGYIFLLQANLGFNMTSFGDPITGEADMLVWYVDESSWAFRNGLRPGDRLVSFTKPIQKDPPKKQKVELVKLDLGGFHAAERELEVGTPTYEDKVMKLNFETTVHQWKRKEKRLGMSQNEVILQTGWLDRICWKATKGWNVELESDADIPFGAGVSDHTPTHWTVALQQNGEALA